MTNLAVAAAILFEAFTFSGRAAAAESSTEKSGVATAAHVFAQVGTGLVEFAHAEIGAFITPHLTIEAMATWAGVFGTHYGGGIMYSFGQVHGRRPPRLAFLLGARVMVDPELKLRSGGDDLNSYAVIPIGLSRLWDNGFYFRGTVGPVVLTEGGRFVVSGPMVHLGFGLAF
jgi:hypothetical protein